MHWLLQAPGMLTKWWSSVDIYDLITQASSCKIMLRIYVFLINLVHSFRMIWFPLGPLDFM